MKSFSLSTFLRMAFGLALTLGLFAAPALGQLQLGDINRVVDDEAAEPTPVAPPPSSTEFQEVTQMGEAGQRAVIQSSERIITEGNVAYGIGRTVVFFKDYRIAADRMVIDLVTQQVQAEGNITLTGPKQEIRASSLRYDFRHNEGAAFDVEGRYGRLFFRTDWDEEENGPSFRRINEDEALFRGATYTACNFPVPHYYMAASEVTLMMDERVFMKNAVLWVRGVPVMYFPFYTRGLHGGSPWSVEIGHMSDYGFYTRIGYQVTHETRVPNWEDPSQFQTRSEGKLALNADLFSGGAVGVGLKYQYQYDFNRHLGELQLYGVRDRVRDVETEDEEDRWIYRHRHNSMYGKTIFQLNADWMSDPDIYYDIIDHFEEIERGRRPERRARAAVTYVERDWVARFMAEVKDRITLDLYQDYTEPFSDDLVYEPDPDFTRENDIDTEGVDRDRYGRVSEKLQGRFATRLLPFFQTPLYWRVEMNALNNLDPGFNELKRNDNERIYGGDLYASLTHRLRLDGQGRFTWLNTVGAGIGYYERTSDDLIAGHLVPNGGGPFTVGGQTFRDRETIFLGASTEALSYRDVDPLYLWVDYTSRLNARFTDTLNGYVKYTIREGTDDGVGPFFEEAGRVEAFEDVYDFPIDYHWVEAYLNYHLLYPDLDMYLKGGHNLQGGSDRFANEKLRYAGGGIRYQNSTGEFTADASVFYEDRQIRDRHDPMEYVRSELYGDLTARYMPRHGRYWAQLSVHGSDVLDEDPVVLAARRRARFDENETEISISPLIGRQFGPKYAVELSGEYNTRLDDWKEAGVTIVRDLHDADLLLYAGITQDTYVNQDDNDDDPNDDSISKETELDFRVSLKFKQPREQAALGAVSIRTLREQSREGSFVD
ncbi:hypothetical protein KQI84_00315 [bacterium]|nr:hypothetical protein [bacterium]